MSQTNKKDSFDAAKVILVPSAFIGFMMMLGAAGNADYNDALEVENQNLGYEKNIIDDKNDTRNMFIGSALFFASAAGLALRKQKSDQSR